MQSTEPKFRILTPGDPAPWFRQRSTSGETYVFDTAAGRWIVLCFFVSAADARAREALKLISECRDLFDDDRAAFFGVSVDPGDEAGARVRQALPGIRHFWDFDGEVSRAYGVLPQDGAPAGGSVPTCRLWFILDPLLRVHAVIPLHGPDGGRGRVAAELRKLPPPARYGGLEMHPPILVLPGVFEPAFCRELVALYETHGGEDSGFMREVDGKTVSIRDYGHKRRADYTIENEAIMDQTRWRVRRRVVPEILKAHQFEVTRMERYIVACYEAETGGHFRAHRDNTTKGTAHRRFAVSINLNDDFDGGEIMFPEYGARRYKAPVGAAVVFSCSMLHQVSPVTRGRRFAFLPFLYDDAAARIRIENNAFLGENVAAYQSTSPAAAISDGA